AALERVSLPPVGNDIGVMTAAQRMQAPVQLTQYLEPPLGAPTSRGFPILVIVVALVIAAAAIVGIGLYA
ncbi:MAG: hypothetical protein ABI678_18110, partial [Kofleriaceae bacterium]